MTTGTRFRAAARAGRQRGQAIVWVAAMLPLFLAVVGLAADGGVVFDARRDVQDVADAAARAGATQLDTVVLRNSSGATVLLDEASARTSAAAYLESRGPEYASTISTSPTEVVVTVTREVPTTFLRIVGITTVQERATGVAQAMHGIQQGSASEHGD